MDGTKRPTVTRSAALNCGSCGLKTGPVLLSLTWFAGRSQAAAVFQRGQEREEGVNGRKRSFRRVKPAGRTAHVVRKLRETWLETFKATSMSVHVHLGCAARLGSRPRPEHLHRSSASRTRFHVAATVSPPSVSSRRPLTT